MSFLNLWPDRKAILESIPSELIKALIISCSLMKVSVILGNVFIKRFRLKN